MTIIKIEITWKTTGFYCPYCNGDLYSDGEAVPTCMVCYHQIEMKDMISQMLEVAPMDADGYRLGEKCELGCHFNQDEHCLLEECIE